MDRDEVREEFKENLKWDFFLIGLFIFALVVLLATTTPSGLGMEFRIVTWVGLLYSLSALGRAELGARLEVVESLLREQRGDSDE